MSRYDAAVGRQISDRARVSFRTMSYRRAIPTERLTYFEQTGYMEGGVTVGLLGTRSQLPQGHLILRGNVMELLHANQWNEATILRGRPATRFGLKRLLVDFAMPLDDLETRWLDEYELWAKSLPANARMCQLDFGFVEHLLPNTLGARNFGDGRNFVMNPFNDRRLIQLAMQIPPELRKSDPPNQYLLKRNCAHLADIPFELEAASDPNFEVAADKKR